MTSGDLNRSYKWSVVDLWEKEISRILLRFLFLVYILEEKVLLIFGNFERTSSILKFCIFERTGFGPQIWRIG
jgi:hypothetical protein